MKEGDTVGPRVVLAVPAEKVDAVFQKLSDRLKSGHVHFRKVVCGKAGYISVLYQEPLFKLTTLKHYIGGLREVHSDVPMETCPQIVPPAIFESLKFPKGIWKSVSELAALADWRNKENKSRQSEVRARDDSANKSEQL